MAKKKKNFLKYIMGIGIGILLVIFINLGIYTFYEQPKYQMPTCNSEGICPQGDYSLHQEKLKNYNNNVFFILLGLGIFLVIISFLIPNITLSSSSLIGGILTLITGIVRYWGYMNKYFRFISVTIILIFLIILSYWKLKD